MAVETQPLYGPVQNLVWLIGAVAALVIIYIIYEVFYKVKKTL